MSKQIDEKDLAAFAKSFDADKVNTIARNAVSRNGVFNAAFDSQALRKIPQTFSVEVKETGSITNQKQSGRCWMFAGLNVIRTIAMEKLKVKDLELSESYLMFYDKLEKSNFELETLLEHLDEPDNSRLLDYITSLGGHQDGGYWSFFVNLVRKYGVVPIAAEPETIPSSASGEMDSVLSTLLAKAIATIRGAYKAGKKLPELRKIKDGFVAQVYKILAISLGKPVTEFTYEYEETPDSKAKDAKPTFKRITMTPKEFFDKYVGDDLGDYVPLLNFPSPAYPIHERYAVKIMGNVVGGEPETAVSVTLKEFQDAIIASLKGGEVCWFGADVLARSFRKEGFLAYSLLDLNDLFSTDLSLDKGSALTFKAVQVNHAMTFTGVDLDDKGQPTRWKVENSWGDSVGAKGFFVMDQGWFENYVFEVIVNKKFLPKDIVALATKKPVEVEPWAPFNMMLK
mgnify:FL=1